MVGGRLWGLVSCHTMCRASSTYETRAVCELLAEAVATRIAALESFAQAQAELSVRRLEQRMIRAISREGDWRAALFDRSHLAGAVRPPARYCCLRVRSGPPGRCPAPGAAGDRGVAGRATARSRDRHRLPGTDAPEFELLTAIASGLLATPVSSCAGRIPDLATAGAGAHRHLGRQSVQADLVGDDPSQLSPAPVVRAMAPTGRGTSDPWRDADLAFARLIGETSATSSSSSLGAHADR